MALAWTCHKHVKILNNFIEFKLRYTEYINIIIYHKGAAVGELLRCFVTSRKVTGSIPVGISVFFIDIKSFQSHCDPVVDSASNRNEYQEYFLWIKAAGA